MDNETGLVIEPENDKRLAEAIAFLIDHRETAVRMGEAGRARANALFTLERYVDESDALYRKVIARGIANAAVNAPLERVDANRNPRLPRNQSRRVSR